MKKVFLILFFVLITTFVVQAQSGDSYLTDAYRLLSEGNIESAENHYIAYQRLTNRTDVAFEALLKEKKEANNKQLKIGDRMNGDVICYLDESKTSGWVFRIDNRKGTWFNRQADYLYRAGWRMPSSEECRMIYKNRFVLGLNATFWTSTQSKKVGNWKFYYTFNFGTGEKKSTDSYKDYPAIYIKNF